MRKIIKFVLKHKIITIIIIAAIAVGSYFGYQEMTKSKNGVRYVLAAVEKGTLITSISGSGQVLASNQVDIKPKVSGDAVYLGVKNGQEVKVGTLLVQIDSRKAQKAVNDAVTSLETAKLELDKLLEPLSELTLFQAENSVVTAKRNLEKAEDEAKKISLDAEQTLINAYEDGYNTVSNAYLNLPDFMKNLKNVLGTDLSAEKNVEAYKLILGANSIFISKLLENYYEANDLFNKNFTFFRTVERNSERSIRYQLIDETLTLAKSISQTLESARNTFDALVNEDYKKYDIAPIVDSLRPTIASNISAINSIISSLQKVKDTIDSTNQNTPVNLKNAEMALEAAKETLREKELSLEELKNGPDNFDVRAKKIAIQQKEDALLDARQSLADYYVRAPFAGVLAKVDVKKGESVSSGAALVTLITKQHLAEISLNEVDATKVKVGQKATLTFDAVSDLSVTGEVAEVDTLGTVTQGVVSYGVKIIFDVQDERIKPGMSTSVSIILESKPDVSLVPLSAVKTTGQESYVEILVNGAPQGKNVTIGASNDTMIEIVSGLKEGEEIITQTINNSTSSQSSSSSQNRQQGFGGEFRMLR